MVKINEIEGIGETYAKKLTNAGLGTVEVFLEKAAAPKGRQGIADQTGIDATLILKWANRADLHRVKGIGSEYADLLEAAGVDTVVELSKRVPANLLAKMEEANKAKELVRKLPTLKQVEDWVDQGKKLPRLLTY